jgi:hypothetical protein
MAPPGHIPPEPLELVLDDDEEDDDEAVDDEEDEEEDVVPPPMPPPVELVDDEVDPLPPFPPGPVELEVVVAEVAPPAPPLPGIAPGSTDAMSSHPVRDAAIALAATRTDTTTLILVMARCSSERDHASSTNSGVVASVAFCVLFLVACPALERAARACRLARALFKRARARPADETLRFTSRCCDGPEQADPVSGTTEGRASRRRSSSSRARANGRRVGLQSLRARCSPAPAR